MRLLIFVLAVTFVTDAAYAQGALLETLDDLRGAPDARPSRAVTPASIDISSSLPVPGNQGETDTCVSWAATYAAATAHFRPGRPELRSAALSPAFTYPFAGGGQFCRGSTTISKTLDVLRDIGALPLPEYAFDAGWCARQPTSEQRARAANYRITGWQKLDAHDLSAVKGQLAEHRPVIFAMSIGPAFLHFKDAGMFDTLEIGADTTGHSMVLVGYDDSKSAFRLMNSFGSRWGDNGYAWISYVLWQKKVSVGFVIATQ